MLPLAGYLVEQGELNLVAVLVTATAGSVLGAVLLYEAARHGGRPFANRFLKFARVDPAKLDRRRSGSPAAAAIVVLAGRCVPGVRSLVSLPAGVLRMPRWEYVLFTSIGSAVWNSVLVGTGYVLGSQWERVADVVGPVSKPLLIVAIVGAGGILWWRAMRARRAA